jgi:hypothetical protein
MTVQTWVFAPSTLVLHLAMGSCPWAKEPLRRPSDAELLRWLTELEIAALAP